jgi:hypothetical protein
LRRTTRGGRRLFGGAAPERIEALGVTTLLHRAADPEESADVVAFLASAAGELCH